MVRVVGQEERGLTVEPAHQPEPALPESRVTQT
jgi:hypothetical protein